MQTLGMNLWLANLREGHTLRLKGVTFFWVLHLNR